MVEVDVDLFFWISNLATKHPRLMVVVSIAIVVKSCKSHSQSGTVQPRNWTMYRYLLERCHLFPRRYLLQTIYTKQISLASSLFWSEGTSTGIVSLSQPFARPTIFQYIIFFIFVCWLFLADSTMGFITTQSECMKTCCQSSNSAQPL